MKTLDEVIKALEICTESHGCIGCPYLAGNDKKCEKQDADALHYLKMYHSDMQMYAENQKYWEDELKQKIK